MAKNKTNLTEKQIEEEAYKVIRGDYGNGDARKQKLGDNYDAVQSKVNQLSKQAGGVSNVKAPSTTVSKPKSTQTNVKTSQTTQKNTTSSVKNESRVRTSSTANPINAPKTTKEEREKARQSYDKTSYKKTETVNAGVPFISSEYKSNEVANANGSTVGTVKSLTKSNNLIEVEQADGSSKRVATKTVNTPSEREKDIEKYNSMTVGEKGYKTGSIRKSKESKAFAEELKQKYGIDDKELDEWNRQYTADKIKGKEERAVEVAKERSKKNAVLGEVAGATVKALDSAEGLGNVIAGKLGKDNQVNFHLQNMAEAYRSGADEKVGTGAKRKALDVGRMVTDLGSKAAVSMATGIPMAVLSAGSSADQSMREAMDRGADVNSAANYGALAGGIDYLLQKKGLDTIFNVKGANLVSSALKKGGVEALEEGAQTVLTRLVDSLTTGEKSRFNIIKQEALANGDSDNEATLKALADLGEETLLSSAGGFAFGGALDLAGAGARRVLPSLAESFRSANYTPKKNTSGDVKVDNPRVEITDSDVKVSSDAIDNATIKMVNESSAEGINIPTYNQSNGITPYTEQRINQLSSHKAGVNGRDNYVDFIDESLNGKTSKKYYFGTVSQEFSDDVMDNLGIDVSNYNVVIDANEIRHSINAHGDVKKEVPRGQLPVTKDILEKLPVVFNRPDSITWAEGSDHAGRKTIQLEKRIDGKIVTFTGVSDGKHNLAIDTIRVHGANEKTPTPSAVNGNSPIPQTPKTTTRERSLFEQNVAQENSNVNTIPSPRNVAEPQKFTEQNVNSQQNIPSDIPVVGGSGDTRYSDVYTNTLHDNDLANLADRIDRRDAEYNVHHNSETMANATNRVNTDAEKWTQDYLSGNVKATDDTDVDTLMLLIHQKKSEMNGATTPEAQAKVQAEFYGLKRKLRQMGTKAGQNVQAFKKWNGTPEGAVLNAERMYDSDAQKWAKRNPNESKAVDTVAKSLVEGEKAPTMSAQNSSKVSNRLSKALSDLGNDSLKASNRVVKAPKTHEQIVSEVINTLDREFGSSRNHFNDTDIEILATFIEQGVPTRTLTDELQHKLQHGDWYTIDESIPLRKDVDPRVISALNKTIEQGETRPPKEQPSLSQLRDRVRNSLDTEYGSLSEKFTDEDVNFIANMINNGASTEDLADALKYKLANNMWEIPEETVNRVNELFNEAQLYNEGSRQRVDLETQAFWQLANASGTKSSIADKFNSWRYLAMLGNPKTHVRNVVGNTLFQGVTGMSNTIAAAMESGVDSVAKRINNGQGIERTKAVLTPSDSSLIKACRTDAEDFSYRRLSGNKYNDNLQSDIRKQKEVFDSRIMRFLNGKNSDFLDKEDYSAMRNKYKTSLAGFLKANGLDESVFDAQHELDSLLDAQKYRMLSTSERARIDNLRSQIDVLNRGRDYAIAQAEYSAFHEDNRVAEILSDMSSKLNNSDSRTARGVGMLFEGALPFKKTPANILKSGLEYSPLNIINNAVKLVGLKKGKGSASDVIESISKTLTGTGLTILGASLYDKGILLSADEDTRWQDDLEGKQNYSLKIGGKTYTIDFAAPSVMPLLLGAEIRKVYDARRNETGEVEDGSFWDKLTSMLEDTTNSLTQLASPIMETSMLSGLNDTLNELSYSDNKLGTLASNTATSYLTQGVPTLLGQIARTVDPVRRDTYTDKTGVAGTVDKKVTKIKNKIPFLSESNEEYVDAYGRPQNNSPTGNMFVNGLYQMFSPSYIANVNETPVDTELRRLYDSGVTDSKIFSDSERKSAPKDSSNQRLSKEDFKEYSTKRGTIDYDVMEQLISSDTYKNLSDEDKASLIQKVHSMAKAFAHNEVDGKSMDSKTAALYDIYKESGIDGIINSFSDTIGYDTFIKDNGLALESNGSGKTTQENVTTFIKSQNLSDEESGKLLFEKWKGGNVDDLGKKDAEFFKGDTPDYAGFWNAHKDKAVEITGQNVNSSQIPVENTTSDVKTIPSPKSLGNTASSNMIRQNAEQVKAQEEAIANFDIDQYTSGTSNGGTRFDEKKGLPALKEVYKTDAERSQAIIDSGVSTKGVDRTREIFGDDYVYQYYEIKAGADSNGDSKVTKKELIPFLQSQGMSEEEINKWWNVYKK